jgi:hypothetical protein
MKKTIPYSFILAFATLLSVSTLGAAETSTNGPPRSFASADKQRAIERLNLYVVPGGIPVFSILVTDEDGGEPAALAAEIASVLKQAKWQQKGEINKTKSDRMPRGISVSAQGPMPPEGLVLLEELHRSIHHAYGRDVRYELIKPEPKVLYILIGSRPLQARTAN